MKNLQVKINDVAEKSLDEFRARTGLRMSEAVSELLIYGAELAKTIRPPSPAEVARAALDSAAKTREDG